MEFLRMFDPELIYDVGANNGDDTAFYLAKGFKVVSIDADGDLCSLLRERFRQAIADNQCSIVQCGVGNVRETRTFYRHSWRDWSSFLAGSKATSEGKLDTVEVHIETLSDLLREHGAPYYMKLDIEGFELQALWGFDFRFARPPFVSFEVNFDWKKILELLSRQGYVRFQLVRQGAEYLPPLPKPARDGATVDFAFNGHMSGPFGRDLPEDRWVDFREIHDAVEAALRDRLERLAKGGPSGWHDIHCAS
jgi:FkbM family methyltransferase